MSELPVLVRHAPKFTAAEAERLAAEHFGIAGQASPLPSERDQNFRIRAESPSPGAERPTVDAQRSTLDAENSTPGAERSTVDAERVFILKIANATERPEILDFQERALAHLAARTATLGVPRVVLDLDGAAIGRVRHAGTEYMVRMLSWVPGRVLADVKPHSRALLVSLGRALGDMDRAFEGFAHPAMNRPLQWDLARTPWIKGELVRFPAEAHQGLIERVVARFESHATPLLAGMRRQVIHNDWNDHNVIVGDLTGVGRTGGSAVVGRPGGFAGVGRTGDFAGVGRPGGSAGVGRPGDFAGVGRPGGIAGVGRTGGFAGVGQSSSFAILPMVIGAVDFGDMLESWTVADLAVACAYAMLGKADPIGAAAAIVEGYHASLPLGEDELDVLLDLIRARLAISVTMAACQSAQAPDNEYLRVSERLAWDLLAALDQTAPTWALASFRRACGLPATAASRAVRDWLAANTPTFASVVNEDLRQGAVKVLDLSVGSLAIPALSDVERVDRFCALVDSQVDSSPGIGRYDEPRLVYVTDLFRHANNWDVENRTVHVGIDVFLPAGAEVRAPLAGVVHSFRNNAGAGDYGPTIILEHEPQPGLHFFTLYGHLSEDSLDGLAPGRPFAAGALIARLGDATVNGGWPPHLHFQVMTDLLGQSGDFPGVAAPSERAIYLDLCPDPNLILGIPAGRFPVPPPSADEILTARRRHLGHNLSVSYRRPLTMVRGHMQFLFDAEGRRFLDAVNNVLHVGHSHPRVVAAAARQLAVLNTNTRYLHPLLASYAERLASLMPDPLSVCYIVCSGSEANELALRLAYSYQARGKASGQVWGKASASARGASARPRHSLGEGGPALPPGVIVVDGAYHGNTTSLVNISPYKFDGPGGSGRPPHTRVALMPDVYRGPYKGNRQGAGALYAEHVAGAVREFEREGRGVAAFFCESLLSCGGQIVLPEGYLQAAYAAVRAAGGVCVADEVQVGFGRVGTHTWGFETQGVVPDIVTLGKPIGNGFPLAAVVTRPEIADAFDNGMEYFNTFGGSHAACAVGHAVLDVMRDEDLQARALSVGGRLRAGLASLLDRFPIVGDVRGLGLFLGVEFVSDRETRAPAARQADYAVNRLRERGILVSTDGPLHNVIKIKPPLQFSDTDADRLVNELAEILAEDQAQP